jgi:hypothetical protein
MFDRFTDRSRELLARARRLADEGAREAVGCETLLLALLADESATGTAVVAALGANLAVLRTDLTALAMARRAEPPLGQLPFTREAKRVLELADEEAAHDVVGTRELLFGLLRVEDAVFASLLERHGLGLEAAGAKAATLGPEPPLPAAPAPAPQNPPILDATPRRPLPPPSPPPRTGDLRRPPPFDGTPPPAPPVRLVGVFFVAVIIALVAMWFAAKFYL